MEVSECSLQASWTCPQMKCIIKHNMVEVKTRKFSLLQQGIHECCSTDLSSHHLELELEGRSKAHDKRISTQKEHVVRYPATDQPVCTSSGRKDFDPSNTACTGNNNSHVLYLPKKSGQCCMHRSRLPCAE